ncbi:class I adenylate-forming enzyme family protein [Geobacillus thermodenitrificans]|uniref:class I adenylate-forming enzyme family protein n=1 Tax=Geobacillus thermodenitrificans TaxID=33940 RepID=UPI000C281F34|nr:class I adenylate-forming enzyme family protein [Geobacillus thermodenitrificans]MED4916961.1 class I adenylate-forming enzyme family protein [Geobacillus thermodenitrificans]PJW20481.1 long-chain acyl-CoA synthetase [Geobacillus thermodenitrificans]
MEAISVLSVPQLLERAAAESPSKEAIYDLRRRITYGNLHKEVHRLASALVSLGIKPGDRVGVGLPNWLETVQLFFAIAKIGAIAVPFNPKYRRHEIEHIIKNSGMKVIFICEELEKHIELDFIQAIVDKAITVRFAKSGFDSLDQLIARSTEQPLPAVAIDPHHDLFCILYTSGTTGAPKGVMVTHRGVVQSGIAIANSLKCNENDVFLICTPIFHIFGMACNLMSAVYSQAKMVLQERYSPKEALQLIERERVTIHHAVPAMFHMELNILNIESFDLSSLRVGMTGADVCPLETVKAIRKKMGMVLCISFGTTETGSVTITPFETDEDRIFETVGKALEGNEVKIVNDRRETLPPGQIGEIACRGFGVMKGYYNMPEQTAEVLDEDGWYYTGDLGIMDERGYIQFVGRKKELIIRGGYNIYPKEIETILQQHPNISASAVIGLPDPVLGETVCAVVQPKEGVRVTESEIVEFLRPLIADYKLPNKVVFVDQFPMTASGKIQKGKLRDMLKEV